MRNDDVPQHLPALGAIKTRGFNLIRGDVVQAGQIQDHDIGYLRPKACGDDAVVDIIFIRQNGDACAGEKFDHLIQQAKIRRVKPRKNQADHDLADDERKEEQRFVDANAAHRLIEEYRHEQANGHGQHEQDQPKDIVFKGFSEGFVIEQLNVIGSAYPGFGTQTIPVVERQPHGLEDRDDHIDQKHQHAGSQKQPRGKAALIGFPIGGHQTPPGKIALVRKNAPKPKPRSVRP